MSNNPLYEIRDPRFAQLVLPTADLEELFGGCRWAEGPVWLGDAKCLLWSDIPNDRMLRHIDGAGVSVFRSASNYANGHTRDRQGRLVTCEHGSRRVTRTEPDGSRTVLAESHQGRRLNSPNDVVVRSDGTVWFTDPDYGILTDYEGYKAEREQTGCHVYRVDTANGNVTKVADDFVKPNGLAFSPDESILYIADSGRSHDPDGPHHIRAFEIDDSGRLRGNRVLCEVEPGVPDGLRCDTAGNLWVSCGNGVVVFSPEGTELGRIRVPQTVSNLTFGGPKRNRLYITATRSLYAIYVAAKGAQWP